mgnify:CR=1 FL=1
MAQRSNSFVVRGTLTCKCQECGVDYSYARYQIGYNTCLECGETQARKVIHCTVPMHKSSYVVITSKADLLHLNQKPR